MKYCDIEELSDYTTSILEDCLVSGEKADFCLPLYSVIYKTDANGERTKTDEFYDDAGDSFEALARYACSKGGIDNCEITQSEMTLGDKEEPNDLRLFSLEEVKYCAGKMIEQLNSESSIYYKFDPCDLVIVEISYEIGTDKYQELAITTIDWYDIYGWPEGYVD